MKATLTRMLWLNCLLLLLAGVFPAQAFYNPTTGRWLSRDPIGELAFQRNVLNQELSIENRLRAKRANVFENQEHLAYVFVGNNPVDKIDLLGLKPCSACGLAVDQALRLTRADVVTRFSKLGFWGQAKACAPIWLPTPGYAMAWDMDDMTTYWSLNMPCGKVTTCDQTVTVGGKCYNAWDVNYMLYGWASSLCGMTLSQMYDHVILWKGMKTIINPTEPARLPGALSFSTLGWSGMYSPLPPEIPPVGYPVEQLSDTNAFGTLMRAARYRSEWGFKTGDTNVDEEVNTVLLNVMGRNAN